LRMLEEDRRWRQAEDDLKTAGESAPMSSRAL
jgi:hypothetical protein